ncbi:SDR family NAD(P)-dependent oxidoreductase [Rhodoferax antarcticus]|uniref:SDR family NAD(P)-dependent oxidoreductase n=1 Tax=Rhodoferax antarcticus TaxID=81479 RepID=UPI0022253488|nr:SDR family NAD(P)-dependent oxidoreductase [Rhodoferax antarcticus]MCW2313029.1 NAD(P)-dependent dehydrogenase (short-subunit alcohol dehydrogenase family) [Rhodoferax antarcticus]
MKIKLFIITGASRGMGFCLAKQLLAPGHSLLCISRTSSIELANEAHRRGAQVLQWTSDLSDPQPAAAQICQWLQVQDPSLIDSASLINNAGVIAPLVPLCASDPATLAQALRVGLEAPLVLTAAFLASTRQWSASRKVLNISSGLGRRPMASQSAYCAAKAGMDHFTRCLALDEASEPNGAKVCSLAPGVIDTDMQSQLRSANPTDFPDQDSFMRLKASDQLTSAHDAAARVLAFLQRDDFGSEPVADVRC